MFRKITIVLTLLSVLALGMVASHADDVDPSVPAISDGRVNSLDIAAPLAVYCQFDYPYDDVNVGVLRSVDVWGFVGDEIEQVISVPAADLTTADAGLLASQGSYGLYLEADGSLTTAGANYTFNWMPGETDNC